jgi:hypothetical protein
LSVIFVTFDHSLSIGGERRRGFFENLGWSKFHIIAISQYNRRQGVVVSKLCDKGY